jgi:hypothetical protein
VTQATAVEQDRSTGFKFGWWFLIVVTAMSVAGHALLPFFTTGEEMLFVGWTTMNLYALVVLLTAYKRGEAWGWWLTWLMPASYASPILFDAEVGPAYFGAAVLMAAAQLITRPAFR